ncbi:hypothetical protein ACFQ0Q_00490 [Streptomyces aureus]
MGLDELELKQDTFLGMLQTQLNGVPLPVSEMTNFPGRWLDRLVLTAAEIRSSKSLRRRALGCRSVPVALGS